MGEHFAMRLEELSYRTIVKDCVQAKIFSVFENLIEVCSIIQFIVLSL